MPESAARAGRLAEAFRDRGLPVVLVSVVGCAPGRTDNSGTGSGELPDDPSGCRSTRASFFRTLAALSKQVPEDGSYERVRPTDCRVVGLVGAGGIEPPTSTSQKWRPTSGLRPVGLNTRLHAGADDRARNKGDLLQDRGHLEPITGRF